MSRSRTKKHKAGGAERKPAEVAVARPDRPDSRRGWVGLLVLVAGVLVYYNSFGGSFVFDDGPDIVDNPRIRSLWPVWGHLARGSRPLVDLSLAVNYHIGQLDVWGYHACNLAVHLLAGVTLFGIVRRTLLLEGLRPSFGRSAPWLALVVSLIWVVHPLQTQSVTYIIQRAESMMGLFYLLTLYCVICGSGSRRAWWWYAAAGVACALGMGSKPVMITAPFVVLLYDRVFLARSFSEILRRRWGLYLILTASWLILARTGIIRGVLNPDPRPTTVGLGYPGFSPMEYALTQPGAILHYLRLSFWPHPLCLDYRWPVATTPPAIAAPALVILALLSLSAWALWRKPRLGFLGAWFFLVLAPTSSVIPIQDPAFEHRMYLPLAGVVVLVVIAGHRALGAILRGLPGTSPARRLVPGALILLVVAALGYGTAERNRDYYHSGIALWRGVVDQRPNNARGHNNLGNALKEEEQFARAVESYTQALQISPNYAEAHVNLANVLRKQGKTEDAIQHYTQALSIRPAHSTAHFNLGNALYDKEQYAQAIEHYTEALRIRPNYVQAHVNLANALRKEGNIEDAIKHYERALEMRPTHARAHYNFGNALLSQRRYDQAIEHYTEALRTRPDWVDAHVNLGFVFTKQGKIDDAIRHYRAALKINPDNTLARQGLADALAKQGLLPEP